MNISQYRDNIELSDICVVVEDQEFNLHKFPLSINCEYFKNECKNKSKIILQNFPAGKANFEMIADHCYGKDVEIKMENVISMFCGSHYLGMVGANNLIEKCQRFIDRIFRSAEYSRSIDDVVRLLDSCKEMKNEELKQFIDKGFVTILQLWLRPIPGFKSSLKEKYIEDAVIFESILRLNHYWIDKFIQFNKDDEYRHPYIGKLVVHYFERQLFMSEKKNNAKSKETINKRESSYRSSSSCEELNSVESSNGSEIIDNSDKVKKKTKKKIKNKHPNQVPDKNQGQCFDDIMNILPNEINLGKIITIDWLKNALAFCDKFECKSRRKLLQVCGSVLTHSPAEEVKQLNSKIIAEMIQETLNNDQIDKELMKYIWDHYFSNMAENHELDPVLFNKVVNNMPESQNVDPDMVFKIVLSILNKGGSQISQHKEELINSVQLENISPENLEAAIESRFWDVEIICKVAIKRLKGKDKSVNDKFSLKEFKDNLEPILNNDIDASGYYGNGTNITSSYKNHSYTSRISSFPNLIDDEVYSNSQDFSYHYYPTTKYTHKCYSPCTYLTLEENLKYELKKISESYTNYYRKRLRARPRRKYPQRYHFQ